MMYPHPIIAKEGWLYLVVIGAVAFVVHRYAGFFWSWPLWLFFVFTLQCYRDWETDRKSTRLNSSH